LTFQVKRIEPCRGHWDALALFDVIWAIEEKGVRFYFFARGKLLDYTLVLRVLAIPAN
jgi:hypothetical protein